MEFGFISYEMNKPIRISNTGHMLIDAMNEVPVNEKKIQSVFLNAMMKYQSNNPYRKNLNSNVPLLLLLNLIKLLKNDKNQNGAGISRQEASILICWPDNNAISLYNYIVKLRNEFGFSVSDEIIYEKCLSLLDSDITHSDRFKMSQICGEAVDEYFRKMRCTGVISLRGNGRFIDFNTFEQERIDYVINNYSTFKEFDDVEKYYNYMGTIDSTIFVIEVAPVEEVTDLRKKTLKKYAKEYSKEKVYDELRKVCKKDNSKDDLLKFINGPTRLEFLTSIALVQQFENLDVNPNYSIDDEGLPTFTAAGGEADIVCYDSDYDSLFEVTLMCGKQDQVNNEIVPIRRHLLSHIEQTQKSSFSVFIAPKVHEDTKEIAAWYKHKDNVDIITYDIEQFLHLLPLSEKSSRLLTGLPFTPRGENALRVAQKTD